jgi:hypothetical protein
MRPSNDLPAVYLCRDVVDFRKGINGLAVLVEERLEQNPFSEQLFVFCNRRRDRVRILYWERNGYRSDVSAASCLAFLQAFHAQSGVICAESSVFVRDRSVVSADEA